MEMSPQLCRAARALLGWSAFDLAGASGLGVTTVKRFEAGALVRKGSVFAMQEALQGAGLEFIPAGGQSLRGGEGVRMQPTVEPEVAEAIDGAEADLAPGDAGIGVVSQGQKMADYEHAPSRDIP
jgi:hypothetical protein